MPKYSKNSAHQLSTCREELQQLFNEVIKIVDCTIVEGYRPIWKQNLYFRKGTSRVKFPNSKHNVMPSNAVDVVPFINGQASYHYWHCIYFAGYVKAAADRLGINLRWGGNWDLDLEVMTDQDFQDLAHYEYVEEVNI